MEVPVDPVHISEAVVLCLADAAREQATQYGGSDRDVGKD